MSDGEAVGYNPDYCFKKPIGYSVLKWNTEGVRILARGEPDVIYEQWRLMNQGEL